MMAKHAKLITVLVFAVMLLILGLLVASVTSCAPLPPQSQDVSAHPVPLLPTAIADGTLHHPVLVDPSPFGTPVDTWKVVTIDGSHETWVLNWLYSVRGGAAYALHTGEYILYNNALYRVTVLNRKALTMTVWGPLDCCAQG